MKPKQNKADMAVRCALAGGMASYLYNIEQIESLLSMSSATLRRRKASPEQFTLKELRIMADKLNFTAEQVCAMLGVPVKRG